MVEESTQNELWRVIGQNMGHNSLELFQQFYQGEDIQSQVKGAKSLLQELFGKQAAESQLAPILQKIDVSELRGAP